MFHIQKRILTHTFICARTLIYKDKSFILRNSSLYCDNTTFNIFRTTNYW